jgi:transposase InsO family protein
MSKPSQTAAPTPSPRPSPAQAFARFLDAFGHPVHTALTDNGAEFTDRFGAAFCVARHTGTGRHPFDRLCRQRGIRHKLTKPYHPQTNGMVGRFNRRLGEALAAKQPDGRNAARNRFSSRLERNRFITAFVQDYNPTRLQCLNYHAPRRMPGQPPDTLHESRSTA